LNPTNITLVIEVLDVEFVYDWERAILDLSSLGAVENYYPEADGIDLSPFSQYYKGFLFNNIETWQYIRGPSILFDIAPTVEMQIVYTDRNGIQVREDLLGPNFALVNSAPFDLDPGNTGTYSGNLPPGGIFIENFNAMLNADASDLQFCYRIGIEDEVTITPDVLENIELDTLVSMEIIILAPLMLTAGPSGADFTFPDLFAGKTDFMDRDISSDKLPMDFLKKLSVNVALNNEMFTGGQIYLDDGSRRILFPLGGKSIGVAVTAEDLEYINNTIPYKPEIGVAFAAGDTVQIQRNAGTIKIDFEAEIEYKLDLTDFWN
jgi:hypothetical protein